MKKNWRRLIAVTLLIQLLGIMPIQAVTAISKEWDYENMDLGAVTFGSTENDFSLGKLSDKNVTTLGAANFTVSQDPLSTHGNVAKLAYDANGETVSKAFDPFVQLNYSSGKTFINGQKIHIGTEFMANSKTFNSFGMFTKYKVGAAASTFGNEFLTVEPSQIKSLNNVVAASFVPSKWYRIDLIITVNNTANATADVYFEGSKAYTGLSVNKPFDGLDPLRYSLKLQTVNNAEVYFDNTVFTVYNAGETIPLETIVSKKNFTEFFDFSNISMDSATERAVDSTVELGAYINRVQMPTSLTAVGSAGAYRKVDSVPGSGVYGKLSTDKSAKVDETITKLLEEGSGNPYYQYITPVAKSQLDDEKTHITLQFATDKLDYRVFQVVGKNSTGAFLPSTPMIWSGQGGNGYMINIFGNAITTNVMPQTWYQIDIIGNFKASGLFDAYLNGTKVLTGKTVPGDYNNIKELRLDMQNIGSTKMYFDNFGIGVYGPDYVPVIKSAALTTDLTKLSINETVKTITINPNETVTVQELLASLTLSDPDATATVVRDGTQKTSGNLEMGDYLAVINGKTQNYYKVSNQSHYMLSFKFDNYTYGNTIADNKNIGIMNPYKFVNSTAEINANSNKYETAVGGKSPIDVSLNIKSKNITYTGSGDTMYTNRDPYYEAGSLNTGNYADLSGKKLVISANVLARDYQSNKMIQAVSYANNVTNWLSPFSFTSSGTITSGKGANVVGKYELNRWYNMTAVINMGTTTYDLYLNGKKLNTDGFSISDGTIDTVNLQRIKFVQSIPLNSVTNYNTESYFDDLQVYIGDYIPNPVQVNFNQQGYYVDNKAIAVMGALTAGELKNRVETNAAVRIYTDNTFTTMVDDTSVLTAGNVVVFDNGIILEYYPVLDAAYSIKEGEGYKVDNTNKIITLYKNSDVALTAAFLKTYDPTSVITVVDANETVKVAGTLTSSDKIRVTNNGSHNDYTVVLNVLVDENFNSYTAKADENNKVVPPGWVFGAITAGETDVYMQGVARDGDPSNNMVKFYSDAKVAKYQFSMERVFAKDRVTGCVVVEASINAKDYKTERMITNKGFNTAGVDGFFESFVLMDRNADVSMLGIKVGKYEIHKWYDFKVMFDMKTGYMRGYINGILVYEGDTGITSITSISNVRMQQNTHLDVGPCETWFDDFKFYNVSKPLFTDYAFNTMINSSDIVINHSALPGIFVPNEGIMTYDDLFAQCDFDNVGYYIMVMDSYGSEKDTSNLVEMGDIVRVISNDGLSTADYVVSDSPYIGRLSVVDAQGIYVKRFRTGTLNAQIDLAVFRSTDDKMYDVVIAQYDAQGKLIEIGHVTKTLTINEKITASATITVTEATGRIKAFLWKNGILQPVSEALLISPA